MTSKRRQHDIDATLLRRIYVNMTSFRRHVPTGTFCSFFIIISITIIESCGRHRMKTSVNVDIGYNLKGRYCNLHF